MDPPAGTQRLPVPAVMLALVCMGALYSTSGGYPGLIALAAALVATYGTEQRLPASPGLAWLIRVVVFGTLLLTENPEQQLDAGAALFEPGYTNLFGYACAAELVIRAWVRRTGGPSKGEVILLSTLILAMATNAGDLRAVWWVRTLAPVYLLLLVMTLRRFQDRPRRWGVGWVAALLLAMGLGAGGSWAIMEFDSRITRWSMRLLAGRRPANAVGLSRTATLGRIFNPHPSPRRVLEIEGWPGEHHLRATSFDQYDQGTWQPPADQRQLQPLRRLEDLPAHRDATLRQFDSAFGLVCAPLEGVAIEPIIDESVDLQQDAGGGIRAVGDNLPSPLVFGVSIGRMGVQGVPALPLSASQRGVYLEVPPDIDPRVGDLAERIGTGDAVEKVARIQQYLRSTHRYSLEVDPGEGDPVSSFLLNRLDGHCVYFASAAVVLARCAGVPARYVSGYYAHEAAGDDLVIVRLRDAHAWAECWIDGTGWVTVDATPAAGRPDTLFPEAPRWRRGWERMQDALRGVRDWLAKRTLIEGAVMIALLAGIPVMLRVWRGRRAPSRPGDRQDYAALSAELAELGRRFERALKRRGAALPPYRPGARVRAGSRRPKRLSGSTMRFALAVRDRWINWCGWSRRWRIDGRRRVSGEDGTTGKQPWQGHQGQARKYSPADHRTAGRRSRAAGGCARDWQDDAGQVAGAVD